MFWSGVKIRVLLNHVELANYDRKLINWTIDEDIYRHYVLWPLVGGGYEKGGKMIPEERVQDWRRPLWEEFYPRIRQEDSPADAASIVVRHLRERVTIATQPGLSHAVSVAWRNQITDETGFAILYVAALRSVGVPARLENSQVEYWDGHRWAKAPPPLVQPPL